MMHLKEKILRSRFLPFFANNALSNVRVNLRSEGGTRCSTGNGLTAIGYIGIYYIVEQKVYKSAKQV